MRKRTPEESNFRIHQETERNTGRARQKHRGRGEEENDATTQDRQGTGPPVKAGRGGGREVDGGRHREEGTPGR